MTLYDDSYYYYGYTEYDDYNESDLYPNYRHYNGSFLEYMEKNYNISKEDILHHIKSTNSKFDYYWIPVFDFEIVTLGFLSFILIVLTTVANAVVVAYFLDSRQRGKGTSILFVSIAISDTLTGIILLPNSVYVYILKNEELSYSWCYVYMHTRLYFSQVFHSISIWQTVLLSVQRYVCVCHPLTAGRLCTFWKTVLAMIVIYITSCVLHINHLLDKKTEFNQCRWSTESPCKESCIYIWLCIIFMHFTPCVVLVCLTTRTILGLRKAGRRVSSMLPTTSGQRSSRDKIITVTATIVAIVFLIPELPYCFYRLIFVMYKHEKHLGTRLESEDHHVFLAVYEIALIISFHCNFWIYNVMMRDFRQKIKGILTCGAVKHGLWRLRSFSRSSRSSGGTSQSALTSVSRTTSMTSRHLVLSARTITYSTQPENVHIPVETSTTPDHENFPPLVDKDDLVDDVFI